MEIYLIRHTTPDVIKGMCYGQTDLDTTESFEEEAACIQKHLPNRLPVVFSSPLKRCRKLAERLFPGQVIQFDDRLKELNCGEWEMCLYDHIDRTLMEQWMEDHVHTVIPKGESYYQLYERVVQFFKSIKPGEGPIAIVTHGGVIRSILSYITKTALKESFDTFSIRYGCTIKIVLKDEDFLYDVLHNPQTEKEVHRPSYY